MIIKFICYIMFNKITAGITNTSNSFSDIR